MLHKTLILIHLIIVIKIILSILFFIYISHTLYQVRKLFRSEITIIMSIVQKNKKRNCNKSKSIEPLKKSKIYCFDSIESNLLYKSICGQPLF